MSNPILTNSLATRGIVLPHAQPSYTIACPIATSFATWLSTNVSALAITLKPWIGKVNFNLTPEQIFDLFSTARSAPGATFYVDVTNGNNTNAGTSAGAAFASIWKAQTAANTAGVPSKIVIIRAGVTSHYGRTNNWSSSSQNVFPTVDTWYEAQGGMIDTSAGDEAGFTWTEDSTYKGMYTCTVSALVSQVVDLSQYIPAHRSRKAMPQLPAAADCQFQPGYNYTGTTLTLRRDDGKAPTTTNTRVLRSVLLFRATSDVNLGWGGQTPRDGFRFMGGANGDAASASQYGGLSFFMLSGALPASRKCMVMSHCIFTHGYRGLEVEGFHGLVFVKDCGFGSQMSDGINNHITSRSGADFLEILDNCWVRNPGIAPSNSNQCLTAHDGNKIKIMSFGCDFEGAHGGNVRNIGGSYHSSYFDRFGPEGGDIYFGASPTVDPVGAEYDDAGTSAWFYDPKFEGCETDIFASAGTSVYIDSSRPIRVGGAGTVIYGAFP